MNYYPFHIGDYASATRHLSWDEDAAYRRLLDVYYTTEKPLPADLRAVCRLVLATTDAQREAVSVVLDEFFSLTDGGWVNRRADEEIHAMREKQQRQRENANKRWHKQNTGAGNAPAMPRHDEQDATASKNDADAMPPTPTPTPTPKKKHSSAEADRQPGFVRFWSAWPKSDRKVAKAACETRWRSRGLEADADRIVAHVEAMSRSKQWRDGYDPAPLTYLNQRRWEDVETSPRSDSTDWWIRAGYGDEAMARAAGLSPDGPRNDEKGPRSAVCAPGGTQTPAGLHEAPSDRFSGVEVAA